MLMLCFGFTLLASIQSHAQTPEEIQYQKDKAKSEAWLDMYRKYGVWAIEANIQTQAKSEREFLQEFHQRVDNGDEAWLNAATRLGGYNRDPLAADFVQNAFLGLNCGVRRQLSEEQAELLDESVNKIKVFSVPFNLCPFTDASDCDEGSVLMAKNYPELNLILVNVLQYNLAKTPDRIVTATHEILGIPKIEQGSYQYSGTIRFRTAVQKTGAYSLSATSYCGVQ